MIAMLASFVAGLVIGILTRWLYARTRRRHSRREIYVKHPDAQVADALAKAAREWAERTQRPEWLVENKVRLALRLRGEDF